MSSLNFSFDKTLANPRQKRLLRADQKSHCFQDVQLRENIYQTKITRIVKDHNPEAGKHLP